MEIFAVSLAALFASALTLFSGFGLGTLLMPVVAIFFPVEVAIAMTAIVHLANNLFKAVLLGKDTNHPVFLRFGLPAIAASFMGALILGWLTSVPSLFDYSAFGKTMHVSILKLVVGVLILAFVALESSEKFSSIALDKKYLPLGGLVSGLFGGLSGHQGAFRSMFLMKAGLSKVEFVATGVMIAVVVDISRIPVYGLQLTGRFIDWPLVISASFAAFVGAYFGAKLLGKVTIRSVRIAVSFLLIVVSLGLISGLF